VKNALAFPTMTDVPSAHALRASAALPSGLQAQVYAQLDQLHDVVGDTEATRAFSLMRDEVVIDAPVPVDGKKSLEPRNGTTTTKTFDSTCESLRQTANGKIMKADYAGALRDVVGEMKCAQHTGFARTVIIAACGAKEAATAQKWMRFAASSRAGLIQSCLIKGVDLISK
jgi:hypothetical protein